MAHGIIVGGIYTLGNLPRHRYNNGKKVKVLGRSIDLTKSKFELQFLTEDCYTCVETSLLNTKNPVKIIVRARHLHKA